MSISSISPGVSNTNYLDQDKSQTNNTSLSNATSSNTTNASSTATTNTNSTSSTSSTNSRDSTDSLNQIEVSTSDNKNNSVTSGKDESSNSRKTDEGVTKDGQFEASFQKSQLLSKLPSDSTKSDSNQPANSSTVKETSASNAAKELGDYGHLSTGQKKLVDELANRQNTANKTNLSPAEFYNKLEPSQKSAFESITNALENTSIIGKDGSKTNALDTIESVDLILGEKKGSKNGAEQFRLIVNIKDGAKDKVATSTNFHEVRGHGDKYPDSYQLNGGEPSFQISFTRDGKSADIDVDYESKGVVTNIFNGFKHLQPSNSDVRQRDHFKKHNERFASEVGQQPLVKKY